eukprot:TRINITY_DN6847_c0_g1_i1.p3 TRINITY_DN6847_c0_g1~~TRINITY_DN6847_c0_g1_i1.p3  ORF type:complete len:119 (-),score=39.03 TRINITY_DN6847_c0_g1_i1:124-480(-)
MAQDFAAAVRHFTRGLELEPTNAVFWSNRSAAHCSLRQYDTALEDANKALEIKPGWAKAFSRQAAALHGLKRYTESIAAYRTALELEPGSSQVLRALEMVTQECEKSKEPTPAVSEES